jgi:uncharacterized membrane protein
MPFCSQCGNQVGAADAFCGRCGSRQPTAPSAGPGAPRYSGRHDRDPLGSVDGRTASILCYVPGLGWIMAIVVLASERFRHNRAVRFHGFQALYLFVAWLMEDQVLRPAFSHVSGMHLHGILQALLLGASIFMMVKASHQEQFSLPLFGDLAAKSMADD